MPHLVKKSRKGRLLSSPSVEFKASLSENKDKFEDIHQADSPLLSLAITATSTANLSDKNKTSTSSDKWGEDHVRNKSPSSFHPVQVTPCRPSSNDRNSNPLLVHKYNPIHDTTNESQTPTTTIKTSNVVSTVKKNTSRNDTSVISNKINSKENNEVASLSSSKPYNHSDSSQYIKGTTDTQDDDRNQNHDSNQDNNFALSRQNLPNPSYQGHTTHAETPYPYYDNTHPTSGFSPYNYDHHHPPNYWNHPQYHYTDPHHGDMNNGYHHYMSPYKYPHQPKYTMNRGSHFSSPPHYHHHHPAKTNTHFGNPLGSYQSPQNYKSERKDTPHSVDDTTSSHNNDQNKKPSNDGSSSELSNQTKRKRDDDNKNETNDTTTTTTTTTTNEDESVTDEGGDNIRTSNDQQVKDLTPSDSESSKRMKFPTANYYQSSPSYNNHPYYSNPYSSYWDNYHYPYYNDGRHSSTNPYPSMYPPYYNNYPTYQQPQQKDPAGYGNYNADSGYSDNQQQNSAAQSHQDTEGSTTISDCKKGSPTATIGLQKKVTVVDLCLNMNRCVVVKEYRQYRGDEEEEPIPDFIDLVNFPSFVRRNRSHNQAADHNGFKYCVMCGHSRPTCATKYSSSSGEEKPTSPAATDTNRESPPNIIPRQNKGLCTACDVVVWSIVATGVHIKWCKGCKNFKHWASFGEKMLATKCMRCRDRQREKYATKKGYKNILDASNNTEVENPDNSHGLSCLVAAISTQTKSEENSSVTEKE